MYAARLGAVSGVADVRTRRRNPTTVDFRGLFAFRSANEREMIQAFEAGQRVEFEGVVEGEKVRAMVTLVSLDRVSGTAFFEGSAESAETDRKTSSQAG